MTKQSSTPAPLTPLGTLLHHARHPLVVLVGLACLWLSAWCLPGGAPEDSRAVRGALFVRGWLESRKLLPARVRAPRGVPGQAVAYGYIYVRLEGEQAHPIDYEEYSWSELHDLDQQGARIGRVAFVRVMRRTGTWAPWLEHTETKNVRVTLLPGNQTVTDEPLRTNMLVAAAQGLGKQAAPMGSPEVRLVAEELARGGARGVRLLVWRVIWNMGTLAALILVAHGVCTQARWWRRERLVRRGTCEKCAYDLLAIPVRGDERTCPECGATTRWRQDPPIESPGPEPSSRLLR